MTNIHCIWYPAGGFGHFVNAVLSLHGVNFKRPYIDGYQFSQTGNSHSLPLIAKKYFHDADDYRFNFDPNKLYSVLIDNGINNESKKFLKFFPNSNVIKICYTDYSWPVVAATVIIKAMNENLNEVISPGTDWNTMEDWAKREKYFLYLRDHPFRYQWKPDPECQTLLVEDLIDYEIFKAKLNIETEDFTDLWTQWYQSNGQYFEPIITAKKILDGEWPDEPVTDIWTQAIVYYQIWYRYKFEVPHNDYSNWFESHQDFVTMLDKHGVSV